MPASVDEFPEDFAGYPITSAIDYYSAYYEIILDKTSRDLTAFLTELGLVRMTRLPQGWTNSVVAFSVQWEKFIGGKCLIMRDLFLMILVSRVQKNDTAMRRSHQEYEDLSISTLKYFVNSCTIAGLG